MDGWIKLWRSLGDSELWTSERFTKGQAWVDILIKTQGTDNEGFSTTKGFTNFERGKMYLSITYLADRWKWSKGKVLRFLKTLEKQNMVRLEIEPQNGTVVTIENWGKFQDGRTVNGTRTEHETKHGRNTDGTNKEGKKEKKNKEYIGAAAPSSSSKNGDARIPAAHRGKFATYEEYVAWRNQ